mgnify:CR=1 FL=1
MAGYNYIQTLKIQHPDQRLYPYLPSKRDFLCWPRRNHGWKKRKREKTQRHVLTLNSYPDNGHVVFGRHGYLVFRLLVMLYIKFRIRIARADEVAWGWYTPKEKCRTQYNQTERTVFLKLPFVFLGLSLYWMEDWGSYGVQDETIIYCACEVLVPCCPLFI